MAGFKRFEDILAWQKAREISRRIYVESSNGEFSKDYDLQSQIRRASISLGWPILRKDSDDGQTRISRTS